MPPLISIITPVRNGAASLEKSILSIVGQTYRDYEYLLIDGGSTDGTLDTIRKYEKTITYWISEPDKGISDAFNKGVLASRGTVLLFLGSDDTLHHINVLEQVAERMKFLTRPYFFYGDVDYVYESGYRRIHHSYSYKKFCKYSCIPHQAMFLDRSFFQLYGLFDTGFSLAMDYEHTARFIRKRDPDYVDIVVSFMRRGGVSSHQIPTHDEMDRVRAKYELDTDCGIAISRVVLRTKLLAQQIFHLNW
jgi:glycosyltransferase involved in cell wall biosynthesis